MKNTKQTISDKLFIKTTGGILAPIMRDGIEFVTRDGERAAYIFSTENYDHGAQCSRYDSVRDILAGWPEFTVINDAGEIVNAERVTRILGENRIEVSGWHTAYCSDEGMAALKAKLLIAD